MNWLGVTMFFERYSMIRVCALCVASVALGACSATGGVSQRADVQKSGLYAGQPAVAFATEFPVQSFAEGMSRGRSAEARGERDLALYLYLSALAHEGDRALAFWSIARVHLARGNDALAEKALELLLAAQPDHVDALEQLGLLALRSGRDQRATVLLQRVAETDGARWRTAEGLGVLADRRGEHSLAVDLYTKALEQAPESASILNNRGYSHLLRGDHERAMRDLSIAAHRGQLPQAWLNLGRVYAEAGHYPSAFQAYLEVLSRAQAYFEVGSVALKHDQREVARTYLEDAIQASPVHYPAAQKKLAVLREFDGSRTRLAHAAATSDRVARPIPLPTASEESRSTGSPEAVQRISQTESVEVGPSPVSADAPQAR